ncbi:MAG: hypothetical protein LBI56_00395 [Puniceicoccales bacterium]|jgi:hypothetical protein|nr:hypothetical protein [Puniceicoccales bacterium]
MSNVKFSYSDPANVNQNQKTNDRIATIGKVVNDLQTEARDIELLITDLDNRRANSVNSQSVIREFQSKVENTTQKCKEAIEILEWLTKTVSSDQNAVSWCNKNYNYLIKISQWLEALKGPSAGNTNANTGEVGTNFIPIININLLRDRWINDLANLRAGNTDLSKLNHVGYLTAEVFAATKRLLAAADSENFAVQSMLVQNQHSLNKNINQHSLNKNILEVRPEVINKAIDKATKQNLSAIMSIFISLSDLTGKNKTSNDFYGTLYQAVQTLVQRQIHLAQIRLENSLLSVDLAISNKADPITTANALIAGINAYNKIIEDNKLYIKKFNLTKPPMCNDLQVELAAENIIAYAAETNANVNCLQNLSSLVSEDY